jgi:hypothetical protein
MMHQMNRSATAGKFEDPDGFRRTPVIAPLPRRGTDAGAAPLDRDESDGSELAGLPVKSLTIPNTVAPPAGLASSPRRP